MLFVPHASATPPPQTPRSNASIFGLNLGRDWDPTLVARDFQEAANLGARWTRFGFGWQEVEPKPGRLYFGRYDRQLIKMYQKNGLTSIGSMGGAPAWACTAPYTRDLGVCPPKPGRAYRRYVRGLVAHFKDRIGVWEVWNEPDHPSFWRPRPNAAAYARLQRVTYRAIKAADPSATVLFAATAGTNLPFTAAVLRRLQGRKAFDAVAAHPYRSPNGPLEPADVLTEDGEQMPLTFKQEMLAIQDTFERYGFGRPDLWITEIGWGANGVDSDNDFVTLEQQAQFLEQTYRLVQTDPDLHFVKVVCWFVEQDNDKLPFSVDGPMAFAGLLRADYSPKPAAETYRRLASGG